MSLEDLSSLPTWRQIVTAIGELMADPSQMSGIVASCSVCSSVCTVRSSGSRCQSR